MTDNASNDESGMIPTMNQDLKNPHLVETAVFLTPVDGWQISSAVAADNVTAARPSLEELLKNAANGNIPTINKTFRVEGVPLLLTEQSYLMIRMVPKFYEKFTEIELGANTSINDYFNVFKANWARMASCCIHQVKTTLSGYGFTNVSPFFFNYINMLSTTDDVYENEKTSYFGTFCNKELNTFKEMGYVGVDPMARSSFGMDRDYSTTLEIHSPFSLFFKPLFLKDVYNDSNLKIVVEWLPNNSIELKIPLKEMLPVFGIPVIPLMSTNSANIEISVNFYDPRYLFPLYGGLIPPPSLDVNIPRNATLPNDCCVIDCDTFCYLNLKVLSDPVNNPLAKAYMEPFLVTRNMFKARYLDYNITQTNVSLRRGEQTPFNIRVASMFYNATHMALFFYNGQDPQLSVFHPIRANVDDDMIKTGMQVITYLKNARGMMARGFYVLDPQFEVKDLQVGLGSSFTPLYSVPLDQNMLQRETVDYFQKYGKDRMVGKVMENRMRMSQGDAFYVFDFTHARGNGYFIDTDNAVTVTGKVGWLNSTDAPSKNETDVSLQEQNEVTISVICLVFYTNYFEALLDQGGQVLSSQV